MKFAKLFLVGVLLVPGVAVAQTVPGEVIVENAPLEPIGGGVFGATNAFFIPPLVSLISIFALNQNPNNDTPAGNGVGATPNTPVNQ